MVTVRIVRGNVLTPFGETPTTFDVPTEPGERVIAFQLFGGHAKNRHPVRWDWRATVTKETT